MPRRYRTLLAVLLLGLGVLSAATFANIRLAATETTITELAPGVFFRKTQTLPKFIGCNQGWVIFEDFVLVIDANFPNQAQEVIGLIRQQTDKPIKYVFDTHYHGDHADGNMHFAKAGAAAVATERAKIEFETKGLRAFEQAQQTNAEEYGGLKYETPNVYFPQKLVFDDGTQRVELIHFGHGHTMGDAVAWLPKHGILFTGDACVNGAFNYMGDSDTASWIAALEAMEQLPVEKVAPGHGELSDKTLLATQKQYFVELRTAIQAMINQGLDIEAIRSQVDLPFYKEWTGVDVKQQVENIDHVHGELSGKVKP